MKSQFQRSTESNSGQKLVIIYNHNLCKAFHSIDIDYETEKELNPPINDLYYGKFKVVCSNYGLILLQHTFDLDSSPISDKTRFILWNTSIRKYKVFSCDYDFDDHDSNVGVGICYDSLIVSYKVVFVSPNDETSVYDVKNESWSTVSQPPQYFHLYEDKHQGVIANGMLHWIFVRMDDGIAIVCFDLLEAGFKELPLPVEYDKGQKYGIRLEDWRGQLCVYNSCFTQEFKIWVMMEYGKKESWTNLMVIPFTTSVRLSGMPRRAIEYMKVLSFTEKGEVVVELKDHDLVVYNPSKSTFRILKRCDCRNGWTVISLVESLVLLE